MWSRLQTLTFFADRTVPQVEMPSHFNAVSFSVQTSKQTHFDSFFVSAAALFSCVTTAVLHRSVLQMADLQTPDYFLEHWHCSNSAHSVHSGTLHSRLSKDACIPILGISGISSDTLLSTEFSTTVQAGLSWMATSWLPLLLSATSTWMSKSANN